MSKPTFDPNQPFTSEKPEFDPNAPFTAEGDTQQPDQSIWGATKAALGSRPELQPFGAGGSSQESSTPTGMALQAAGKTLAAPIRTGATIGELPDVAGQIVAEEGGRAGYPKTAATVGTAIQMAPYIAAGVSSFKPISGAIDSILPSEKFLKDVSNEAAFRTVGGRIGDAKELGPDAARELGRFSQEKDIAKFRTGPMREALDKINLEAGKKIEALRLEADVNSPAPKMADVIANIKQKLGPKYASGVEAGGQNQLDNAVNELLKAQPMRQATPGEVSTGRMEPTAPWGGTRPPEVNRQFARGLESQPGWENTGKAYQDFRVNQEQGIPEYPTSEYNPTHSDYAQTATNLNSYASRTKLLQDSTPITDVANTLSEHNNSSIEKALGPQKYAEYKKNLEIYNKTEQIKKMLLNKEAGQIAGRGGKLDLLGNIYQEAKDRFIDPAAMELFGAASRNRGAITQPNAKAYASFINKVTTRQ